MKVSIDLADSITLRTSGISGPDIQQVGADPVWEDDSDATYVDLVGKFYGPTEPAFYSKASVDVLPQSFAGGAIDGTEPTLQLRIDVRLQGLQTGLPFPLVQWIASDTGINNPTNAPANAPGSPTTVTLIMDGFGIGWTSPEQYHIEIVPTAPSPVPGSSSTRETRNWYIYEVRPYWYVQAYGAPPCRMFPRSDGLGVGAGRNYPTPKSQQRSNRGVGFY